jgi:hypothetical protein
MATQTATKPDTSQKIAERAYERFVSRGGEHGRDLEDWFVAESEVSGTRSKRVVAKPRAAAKTKRSAKT